MVFVTSTQVPRQLFPSLWGPRFLPGLWWSLLLRGRRLLHLTGDSLHPEIQHPNCLHIFWLLLSFLIWCWTASSDTVVQWLIIITARESLGKVTINKTTFEFDVSFDKVSQLKIMIKPRCNLSKMMKCIKRLKTFKGWDCQLKARHNHLEFSYNLLK